MGWVGSFIWWVELGWVNENRPTDNSGVDYRTGLTSKRDMHVRRPPAGKGPPTALEPQKLSHYIMIAFVRPLPKTARQNYLAMTPSDYKLSVLTIASDLVREMSFDTVLGKFCHVEESLITDFGIERCRRRSEIIAFSIGDFGGRNFAGGRQAATPQPDSDYAEC